jgi:hypothetical protein
MDKINEDYQCGFQCKRSTTYLIFCIHKTIKKNGGKMGQYTSNL